MARAMIISVGGSEEPLIRSIQQCKPDSVCFFTSQQSIDKVPLIKDGTGFKFNDHKFIVLDINDLTECYQVALKCSEFLTVQDLSAADVLV